MNQVEQWATGRLLSTAARMVEHAWNIHLSRWDLNHASVAVLHVLREDPLTQRELAQRVQVQEQTVSRIVEGLERRGYLTRHRSPADRRRKLVQLTEVGQAVLDEAVDIEQIERPFAAIDPDDLQVLRRALVTLVRSQAEQRWPDDHPEDGSD
jgi:MarR family transcriptional regulator, organic hydroperoxide resistance regulator